ncbi:MAG TPA: hypothetical protein VGQ57_15360 [Polyangiaceae bacterium]|jgi:hypothetical protein|nr:hypothetical protein [Polyangiaceae bacterium]
MATRKKPGSRLPRGRRPGVRRATSGGGYFVSPGLQVAFDSGELCSAHLDPFVARHRALTGGRDEASVFEFPGVDDTLVVVTHAGQTTVMFGSEAEERGRKARH